MKKNERLFPNNPFFERTEPLTIKRSYVYEEVDCSFTPPTPTGVRIGQTLTLAVTTDSWPIRLTVRSDFGEPSVSDIFLDDDTMLALTEAYIRLRGHYDEGGLNE